MKTCLKCNGEMSSRLEEYPYTGCGFTVILSQVQVHRCARCDACAVSIPNIDGLHNAIARMLIDSDEEPLADGPRAFLLTFIADRDPGLGESLAGMEFASAAKDRWIRATASMVLVRTEHGQNRTDPGYQRKPTPQPAKLSLRNRAETGPTWDFGSISLAAPA